MPRDESPDAQYERLKRQLQDSILNDYPNPERKGCPGDAVLNELAARPLDDSLEGDANWHHVTHCSECYREFLGFRGDLRRKLTTRRVKVSLGLAAAVILVAASVFFASRHSAQDGSGSPSPQIAERVFRPRIVDLEGRSMTRADGGNDETKPILLEREPAELTIRLPIGSKAGPYEVRIAKNADQPLASANGDASIQNGTAVIAAKMDLSKFEPGNYFICVRRLPWDWTCYPAVIK
jgi:hypothetical protein